MRIRTGLAVAVCCCAGLTGCTASAPRGPQTTVTAPSVGRPQPPSSVQAALSREPFTPTPRSASPTTTWCATITQDFTNAADDGALAGIQTLSNDIATDVQQDAAVKNATQAWTACMARNGYSFQQPDAVFFHELQTMYGGGHRITPGAAVSAAANQAQLATAVSDADCTQSADLAGIYFAVQASYEQQLVNANAQALTTAVQQYRAAYARELAKLPSLLRTAQVTPFPTAKPARAGS